MGRPRTIFVFVVIMLLSISSAAYASGKIAAKSSGVYFGVREYYGQLPHNIRYQSLGEIEARGEGGMTVAVIQDARMKLLAQAKQLGANAIIDIKIGRNAKAEAVIVDTFPDIYTEADFKDFNGKKEYSYVEIFNGKYDDVYDAIRNILERELYDIEVADLNRGIIETKPIETTSGKPAIFSYEPTPYPLVKLVIALKKTGDGRTQVTEKYVYLRGTNWSDGNPRKSNKIFFRDIEDELNK